MKIAYLFLAHDNPGLIRRVVRHLSVPECGFFLHVDAKADVRKFLPLLDEGVQFTEDRVPVFWGEFSQVDAMLLLIRQALAAAPAYDYFVLLSGSHYPLRSGAYIRDYLATYRGTEFMTLVRMPNEPAGKPLSRLTTLRFPSRRPVLRQAFRVLGKLHLATRDYRRHFGDLLPYAGSTWWALSRAACQHLVAFHETRPQLARFYVNSFASDESYFHTILGNSPFMARTRRNLVYEDWTGQNGHPQMLGEKHLAFFASRNAVSVSDHHGPGELLFARKFSETNPALLAQLDALIKAKERAPVEIS
jgi:hypothetical protein